MVKKKKNRKNYQGNKNKFFNPGISNQSDIYKSNYIYKGIMLTGFEFMVSDLTNFIRNFDFEFMEYQQ